MALFIDQCRREILLHMRQPRLLVYSSLFFVLVIIFFPLTMPAEKDLMRVLAPGLAWIAILLANLLSSVHLFQQDYIDGRIEQWLVSGYPLSSIICAKLWTNWLVTLVPIVLFCPLLTLLFNLNAHEMVILVVSLIIGTPALLFLSGLAAAFSSGQGVLMALVLLPLTVPVMVFGSSSLIVEMQGLPANSYLAILGAISILATTTLPYAIAALVRISLV